MVSRTFLQKIMQVSLVVLLFILVGSNAIHVNAEGQTGTKRTLKVMYQAKYLFDEALFKKQFPDVVIQEVPWDRQTELSEFIAKQSPDVIMLNPVEYKQLSKNNQLQDVGQLIQRDSYATETIYPGLLDALKVNGKLYGLSPYFNTESIFYNVDLFKKYNVPLPKDGMTWEEILKLAAKFPTKGSKDTRVWGLYYPLDNYVYLINDMATSEGLSRYDANTLKVTIHTPAWKKLYSTAITAMKSGTMEGSNKVGFANDPFIMGRAAMTVSTVSMDTLRKVTADKSAIANYKSFAWGIAAGPADPKDRTQTRNVTLPAIMAIPVKSANSDLAWDFIQFYNGVDYAKSRSGSFSGYSLSRMEDSQEYQEHRLDAFYKLKPNLDSPPRLEPKGIPFDNQKYSIIVTSEIKQVLNNKKTLDKALISIQTQVQASLDQVMKKQTKK
ncbi:putative ABC transporter substrate-binding protein YesO [compost metagenome]